MASGKAAHSPACLLPPTTSRSHNLRISAPVLCRNQSYQNIISRTVTIWNGLPPYFLNSLSCYSFRRALSIIDPYLRVRHLYAQIRIRFNVLLW